MEIGLTRQILAFAAIGFACLGVPSAWAAPTACPTTTCSAVPACPASLQSQANQALIRLDKKQRAEDQELRAHPTSSYATMNGPVVRELEKRQQKEALEEQLQGGAFKKYHCQLTLS
jgi:hypothetical protein